MEIKAVATVSLLFYTKSLGGGGRGGGNSFPGREKEK